MKNNIINTNPIIMMKNVVISIIVIISENIISEISSNYFLSFFKILVPQLISLYLNINMTKIWKY